MDGTEQAPTLDQLRDIILQAQHDRASHLVVSPDLYRHIRSLAADDPTPLWDSPPATGWPLGIPVNVDSQLEGYDYRAGVSR